MIHIHYKITNIIVKFEGKCVDLEMIILNEVKNKPTCSLSHVPIVQDQVYIFKLEYIQNEETVKSPLSFQSRRMKDHGEIWETQTGRITGMKAEETGSRKGINNTNSF